MQSFKHFLAKDGAALCCESFKAGVAEDRALHAFLVRIGCVLQRSAKRGDCLVVFFELGAKISFRTCFPIVSLVRHLHTQLGLLAGVQKVDYAMVAVAGMQRKI